ncbi:hypothetical protein HQ535_12095 [bacterium]|nr:hypothetical protein [bacterium]
MWGNRLRGLALAISMVLVLGACGDDDAGSGFDSTSRNAYMTGCLEDGNEAFCSCTLDEFEQRYSQDEFEALALELSNPDEAPEAFVEVILMCISELDG